MNCMRLNESRTGDSSGSPLKEVAAQPLSRVSQYLGRESCGDLDTPTATSTEFLPLNFRAVPNN